MSRCRWSRDWSSRGCREQENSHLGCPDCTLHPKDPAWPLPPWPSSYNPWGRVCRGAMQPNTIQIQNTCNTESKGWAGFGAKRLLSQFFTQVQRRMTAASRCRPSNHSSEATIVAQLLRLGTKCKMWKRRNTGKIKTITQNTSSSSILRWYHPCQWFCPGLQFHTPCPPSGPIAVARYRSGGKTTDHGVNTMVSFSRRGPRLITLVVLGVAGVEDRWNL